MWVVKEIILHGTNLDDELRISPQRRYLTVEIWGYDLNNMYDLDVKVKYKEGDEEKLPTEVIEMTDEDGGTIYG